LPPEVCRTFKGAKGRALPLVHMHVEARQQNAIRIDRVVVVVATVDVPAPSAHPGGQAEGTWEDELSTLASSNRRLVWLLR